MYDYWSLKSIKWDNGANIEDLITFGINPIKTLTDAIDDEMQRINNEEMIHVNFAVKNILENMEHCIYRLKEASRQAEPHKTSAE